MSTINTSSRVTVTFASRRPRTSMSRIPRKHTETIELIWKHIGTSPFVWSMVSPFLTSGPGIIKTLNNADLVISLGRAFKERNGNQRLWKLSNETSKICEDLYGKVDDDREENARIALQTRADTLAEKYSYRAIRDRRKSRVYEQQDIPEAVRIHSLFGLSDWRSADINKIGIDMSSGKLSRWRKSGIIEFIGTKPGNGRHSPNYWRLNPQILNYIPNSTQAVTA